MGKSKYRLSQARKSKKSVMKKLALKRWKTVANLKVEEQSTVISANEMPSDDILDITKSFILYNDAPNEVVYDTVYPALVSPKGHSSSRNESDDFALNLLHQIVVDGNTSESDNVDYCDDEEECFTQYSKTTNEISDHIQNTPDKLVDSVPTKRESNTQFLQQNGIYNLAKVANVQPANHAASLLQDVDINCAETYNSVVAKFVEGKRVKTLKSSYQTRCMAAAISYNSSGDFVEKILERIDESSVAIYLEKHSATKRRTQAALRKKDKSLFMIMYLFYLYFL
ncbi:hypothetical protein FQA39_LY09437 [Lamprigera yunnana]|nr:hypothetical protein FQA39_LY09437 [Lamprigera yunnana]